MSSPAKLTDTQCAILSEASERKDRCLIPPKTLKAAAAQKVATKLLKAGLVREIKAKTGMEAWRRDEETGQAYSLKLTDAGLKAIAADERGSQSIPSTAVPQNTNEDLSKAKTAANMAAARSATAAPTATTPCQGTKIARVIELLQREQGARLEELIAATGWLPHTARAALTGLRHRGYDVRLERGETGRASVYRAVATFAASAIPMRPSPKSLRGGRSIRPPSRMDGPLPAVPATGRWSSSAPVVDAVRCAVEIQNAMVERNAGVGRSR